MQDRQIEVRRRKVPYTNIKNDLIWDSRLRLQTRFALIAMLSLPEDWDYSIRGMAAKLEVSKDTMARMVKELEEAGYLKRKTQEHAASGQFGRARYILTDVPNDFGEDEADGMESPEAEPDGRDQPEGENGAPCPDLPYTASPDTKNSPQQNNKEQTNKQDPPIVPQGGQGGKKKRSAKSVPQWKPERFEKFWAYYPRHEDRVSAVREWDRLKPSDELIDAIARALLWQTRTEDWPAPYACRYLRNQRWLDEPPKPKGQAPRTPGQSLSGWHYEEIDGEKVLVIDEPGE